MLTADLYYSFRSPYSYLGSWRYLALTRDYDLEIRLRPVYPAALRFPGFFKQRNPLFGPYLIRDVARVAEMTGIPCQRPDPDPVQFSAPGEAAAEQPFIHRLTYLGLEAARRGRGLEWACEVGKLLWGDHVKDWHLGPHLAEATTRAGLDLTEMEPRSPATKPRSRPKSPPTKPPRKPPATGAPPASSSRTNPSLAKTASTWHGG